MELTQVLSFALVATLLVVSPGPNGLLISKTVPLFGRVAGFANIAGFVTAFYIHGTLSILGISVLLVQSAQAFLIFKMLGAAYLCYIGIKALLSAVKSKQVNAIPATQKKKVSLTGAYFEGLLTNVMNPKVSMFYLAALPQFIPYAGAATEGFILVTLHAFINLLWFSALVLILAKAKQVAQSDRVTRWLNSFSGVVFIGFGIKLALLKPMQSNT